MHLVSFIIIIEHESVHRMFKASDDESDLRIFIVYIVLQDQQHEEKEDADNRYETQPGGPTDRPHLGDENSSPTLVSAKLSVSHWYSALRAIAALLMEKLLFTHND